MHPPRRVSIALKPRIKDAFDEMQDDTIILKVQEGEPTQWVNSLVYTERKNGKLRVCLDPKDLNKAIRRDHHVTQTLEEVLPKLANKKVFSILDAKWVIGM